MRPFQLRHIGRNDRHRLIALFDGRIPPVSGGMYRAHVECSAGDFQLIDGWVRLGSTRWLCPFMRGVSPRETVQRVAESYDRYVDQCNQEAIELTRMGLVTGDGRIWDYDLFTDRMRTDIRFQRQVKIDPPYGMVRVWFRLSPMRLAEFEVEDGDLVNVSAWGCVRCWVRYAGQTALTM